MSKLINGLVCFAIGATAGIITGLLIAPRKGEETRQLIKDKAKKTSKHIADEFEEKIEEIQDKFKNFKEKVEEEAEESM